MRWVTLNCDARHRLSVLQCSNNGPPEKERRRSFMFLFGKPARPYIVWRHPAPRQAKRKAKYRDTVPEGRKYEVLERACGCWVVVAELTIVDGQPQAAA